MDCILKVYDCERERQEKVEDLDCDRVGFEFNKLIARQERRINFCYTLCSIRCESGCSFYSAKSEGSGHAVGRSLNKREWGSLKRWPGRMA